MAGWCRRSRTTPSRRARTRARVRAAERVERLERDRARLERRVRGRTESLARQFDRVLRVMGAWGYVDGWSLTEAGEMLARLYHETDLLVAEAFGRASSTGSTHRRGCAGVVLQLRGDSRPRSAAGTLVPAPAAGAGPTWSASPTS